MNSLGQELVNLVTQAVQAHPIPAIRELILPHLETGQSDPVAAKSKYAKFGLLVLEDGSAGFFYRLPETGEGGTVASSPTTDINELARSMAGQRPESIAKMLFEKDNLSRGLGMAAINAVSQSVFRGAGFSPDKLSSTPFSFQRASDKNPTNQNSKVDLKSAHLPYHVGMIGYFGPTITQLREQDISLTVLELDETLFTESTLYTVTGDAERLLDCDHIICTASTLINQTLEPLLDLLGGERHIEVVGPTCGCFADPLFARGVQAIGGSEILNLTLATKRITAMQPWGESVGKYQITPDKYPGLESLLATHA